MYVTRRRYRVLGWTLLVIGGVSWLAMAIGAVRPCATTVGRAGAMLGNGGVAITWATGAMGGFWHPGEAWPHWQLDPVGAQVLVAPEQKWRPSTGEAGASVSSSFTFQGTVVTSPVLSASVRIYWMPLWWPGTFGILIGLPLLVWARTSTRGRCPHCGYDLRGLRGSNCPECGHVPSNTALS